MIPEDNINIWSKESPWQSEAQIEQDLILSRALIELFKNPILKKNLIFRGGTALHKLFFNAKKRYSEDIDLVQKDPAPIGPIMEEIRAVLNPWLGRPLWKQTQGRVTFYYRFDSEIAPSQRMKVKIEINTREHFQYFELKEHTHKVNNPWFTDEASLITYSLEELLATKLRALFQRKKGRDLFDLYIASQEYPTLNFAKLVECFQVYMSKEDRQVSRAEFENNLSDKINDAAFLSDIQPLLQSNNSYNANLAYETVLNLIISHLPGHRWNSAKVPELISNTKTTTFNHN